MEGSAGGMKKDGVAETAVAPTATIAGDAANQAQIQWNKTFIQHLKCIMNLSKASGRN